MTEPEELPAELAGYDQPEAERIALTHGHPLPSEDEETCLRMLTPLMKRYSVLTKQREQDAKVYEEEIQPLLDRWAAIDQKNEKEQEHLLPLIESWGRALLAHDDTRKSRHLQWGRIGTRRVAGRVEVANVEKLAASLAHYGKEVPYNKQPKPEVSLSKLAAIVAVLPTVPEGAVWVASEERFSVEVAK